MLIAERPEYSRFLPFRKSCQEARANPSFRFEAYIFAIRGISRYFAVWAFD
jgi:hypothetical protein